MPSPIRLKAHAKINWALNVTGILPDGYHSLDMVVQRISLCDDISLEPADGLLLTIVNDDQVPMDESNLVIKAANALRAYTGATQGARIHLIKNIPSQAGLGGGSADAAAVLQGLNTLWQTGLPLEALSGLGLKLGADVPLCLRPGLMRASGKGEQITTYDCDAQHHLVLVQPDSGLSTVKIFQAYDRQTDSKAADVQKALAAVQHANLEEIAKHCHNQLEATATAFLPDIAKAKNDLYAFGAGYAQMSGSGSAVFGVFKSKEQAMAAQAALARRWPVCVYTTT